MTRMARGFGVGRAARAGSPSRGKGRPQRSRRARVPPGPPGAFGPQQPVGWGHRAVSGPGVGGLFAREPALAVAGPAAARARTRRPAAAEVHLCGCVRRVPGGRAGGVRARHARARSRRARSRRGKHGADVAQCARAQSAVPPGPTKAGPGPPAAGPGPHDPTGQKEPAGMGSNREASPPATSLNTHTTSFVEFLSKGRLVHVLLPSSPPPLCFP
jgi:hypothetical protein